jgi:hypothetical protein
MPRRKAIYRSLLALVGVVTTVAFAQTALPQQDSLSGALAARPSLDPAAGGPVDLSNGNGPSAPANILEDGPRDVGSKPLPTMCEERPLTDELTARCRRWAEIALATPSYAFPVGRVEIAADARSQPRHGPRKLPLVS